eukprot:scpid104164/ scgid34611/ 
MELRTKVESLQFLCICDKRRRVWFVHVCAWTYAYMYYCRESDNIGTREQFQCVYPTDSTLLALGNTRLEERLGHYEITSNHCTGRTLAGEYYSIHYFKVFRRRLEKGITIFSLLLLACERDRETER